MRLVQIGKKGQFYPKKLTGKRGRVLKCYKSEQGVNPFLGNCRLAALNSCKPLVNIRFQLTEHYMLTWFRGLYLVNASLFRRLLISKISPFHICVNTGCLKSKLAKTQKTKLVKAKMRLYTFDLVHPVEVNVRFCIFSVKWQISQTPHFGHEEDRGAPLKGCSCLQSGILVF